jgi:hypothetical protein
MSIVRQSALEDIQGLDARFERGADGEFVLHGIQGDFESAESFEPWRQTLAPQAVAAFAPPGSGKSSDGPKGWPYFNLQTPGGGIIVAVGWPGQWAASFTRDAGTGLTVRAGQQLTRLYLKPGEEIRTPLTALLFWHGDDVVQAQNLWRRWYRAHNMPRVGGEPQTAISQIQVGGQGMTENLYVQGHLAFWDELLRRHPHLRIDSCASGGRRNDLETMRRAVPLLRSDFQHAHMPGVVEGNQAHTYACRQAEAARWTAAKFGGV